ncbi:MAG: PspC domain-containing protein [Coriobacteriia bacterium]|nr:PspC domain-containing protein [Coriobacteriia bacterium]
MDRTLYRSRGDRVIAGVAGGLGEYLGVDPVLIRVGIVLLALVGNLAVVAAYIVMAIVVPEEPAAGERPAGAETEVRMAEERMGPGDMPEPGDFGRPPAPDPFKSAPPPAPPPRGSQGPQPEGPTRRGGTTAGLVLIALGVVFLLQRFIGFDILGLWPLILIAAGIWIMFRRRR